MNLKVQLVIGANEKGEVKPLYFGADAVEAEKVFREAPAEFSQVELYKNLCLPSRRRYPASEAGQIAQMAAQTKRETEAAEAKKTAEDEKRKGSKKTPANKL